MLKPDHFVLSARVVLVVGALVAATLMLGPFQGLEQVFGLSDKTAHALAFGGLTALAFLACPRMRRADLALAALLLGGGVEVAQLFGGRSASLLDWLADGLGIGAVYAVSLVEGLRKMAREQGEMPLQEIARMDRRKQRQQVEGGVPHPTRPQGTVQATFAARAARKFPAKLPS